MTTTNVWVPTHTDDAPVSRRRRTGPWYVGAVVTGAVLFTVTAINQPYNQNELAQVNAYSGDTFTEITSGTRQPPLDPLLGALVQRALGVGQLQQRLVPVLAGVGTLVVLSLLLRRLGSGWAGVYGIWVLATAPMMVFYSAYARPYALPTFLMVVFVFAAHRWVEDRRDGWGALAVVTVTGLALPAARVIESIIFLVTVAGVLAWGTRTGRFKWSRTGPLLASIGACLLLSGYPQYRALASQVGGAGEGLARGGDRLGVAVHELGTAFLPLMSWWFPWWPVTLLVLVAAVAVRASRRRLRGWWFFPPLALPAAAWVLIYHFASPYPLVATPYMPRYALLFMPAYALIAVALAASAAERGRTRRGMREGLMVLLAAALVGQWPTTFSVLHEDIAPDYHEAAVFVRQRLPDDAIILYDAVAPPGRWHQPWSAKPRYMGSTPHVGQVSSLMRRPRRVPTDGPVYVLLLDSECAGTTLCDDPPARWDGKVPGWRVRSRFDRFTVYEPVTPLHARLGVIHALTDFGRDLGPGLGTAELFSAASLLRLRGRVPEARALLARMYAQATPSTAQRIRDYANTKNVDPFERH